MKCTVQDYKKSINESVFSANEISMIWDFYVTKSVAASASQKRTASNYGLKQLPFKEMVGIANILNENYHILMADKIPNTLVNSDLRICDEKGVPIPIDIDTPRFALIMGYTISDDNAPTPKGDCSKPECLLTHIRNALAHGNTYFFENGKMLLEDKNNRITTAMILIKQRTLLDWIKLIDREEKYYQIDDVKTKGNE